MTAHTRLTAAHTPGRRPARRALLCGAALALALLALPAAGLAINDDPVLRRMDAVLEENARAREEAIKARGHGTEASKKAQEALNASEDKLERTRAEALAHVAGVSPAQVEGLRKDGRSWGQAAGELGVHPGFLGVGKAPLYEPRSARAAADQPTKGKRLKKGGKPEPELKKNAKSAEKPAKGKKKAAPEPQKPPASKKPRPKSTHKP